MATVSAQKAFDEIFAHIRSSGGAYREWYVGIASDARQRLFVDHNVSKDNGRWILRECESDTAARNVEAALIKLGCDGGGGGGDSSTKEAYAYYKTNQTNP